MLQISLQLLNTTYFAATRVPSTLLELSNELPRSPTFNLPGDYVYRSRLLIINNLCYSRTNQVIINFSCLPSGDDIPPGNDPGGT